jgi:hypothetical protein
MFFSERSVKFNSLGSLYLEVLLAVSILGVASVSILPFLPKAIQRSQFFQVQSNLVQLADSAGEYLFLWLDSSYKKKKFSEYNDGERINDELSANRLMKHTMSGMNPDSISDRYKVFIAFFDSAKYKTGAIAKIRVWYDRNENDVYDGGEPEFSFKTFVAER